MRCSIRHGVGPRRGTEVRVMKGVSPLASPASPRRCLWNLPDWYAKNAKTPEQIKLKEELQRGYWWEGQELMRYPDGKLWQAPRSLLPPSHGPAWPSNLHLRNAASLQSDSRISIPSTTVPSVLFASGHRFAAWPMIESWSAPLMREFPLLVPQGSLNELCLVADGPYAAFSFVWERLARSQAPKERHPNIAFIYGNQARALRHYLGVDNRLLAYVFLLDPQARVRWRAVGHATTPELSQLYAALRQLQRDCPPSAQAKIGET